jgi:hypothetical protein
VLSLTHQFNRLLYASYDFHDARPGQRNGVFL